MNSDAVHDLLNFGLLHVCKIDGNNSMNLRAICKATPCEEQHDNIERLLPPQLLALMHQTRHGASLSLKKLPDGYIVVADGQHVVCMIKDDHICQPRDEISNTDHSGGNIELFSLVSKPGQETTPFIFSKDKKCILEHNECTNLSNLKIATSKLMAAIPLTQQTRSLFQSPNFANVDGFNVEGCEANNAKQTFMKLISKTNGRNMYDTPIKLSENLSKILRLKTPDGMICCAPLKNGIMGYRTRKSDNAQTLIFIANSSDFFDEQPKPVANSSLQVFKMTYYDKTGNGNRIFVNTTGIPHDRCCPYGTPPITPDMTVQEGLNIIEYAMRNAYLDHTNCADYPKYCEDMKMIRGMISQGELHPRIFDE